MRDGEENIVMQMAAKLNHLLAMAGWAKPAPSTTKGKKILMVTIGAAYSGEALMKVTTFQVFSNYMGNYRTEEAIFTREEIVVTILEVLTWSTPFATTWCISDLTFDLFMDYIWS
jgi:hypothetical protein